MAPTVLLRKVNAVGDLLLFMAFPGEESSLRPRPSDAVARRQVDIENK